MRDQYDSRNKPRRNRREIGTWRLTSIWVVNRTPALVAVAPVLEGVDMGDMWSGGQTLEQGVVPIFAVRVECNAPSGAGGPTWTRGVHQGNDKGPGVLDSL
jgi:hypothetical protein